ncbi:unnamed protein product (macronuclear) [Paramecium tetraurelia]|uniref:Uncharacterized protein n=1 Tax=Paramecium tetraurelia TaxID=5888 RepID=A0D1J0_PARTE|nr:uncharacterized protein GSPATT00012431001 [Paramecium tetraurelia]CAK76907.1 unnamed protein product [Paramecium tetraurelia]|eukprot:XP_001444304.1 hypothetical protein (macronuclear) [Paramecium tetraurelia strain d4-2]
MHSYLEELKKKEIIVKQINSLIQQLQQHHLTQSLVPKSHQDIAEFMVLNRLRNVDTYIQLCEMTGKCLGQARSDIKENDRTINDLFHIQLLQFGLQRKKDEQKAFRKHYKIPIIHINTPSTEQESCSLYNKKLKKKDKYLKLQKVIEQIQSNQSLRDQVKIEEYFQTKKMEKLLQIDGWKIIDQSPLHQPVSDQLIKGSLHNYYTYCRSIVEDFMHVIDNKS